MNHKFWHERWQTNDIGFHKDDVHHYLTRYYSHLKNQTGPVFVPLCGKSYDLLWLREQGREVIGVELSKVALDDFFRESELSVQVDQLCPFQRHRTAGMTLYQGDFFALTPAELNGVHTIYDRAALVALPPQMRPDYARKLTELLPVGGQILLISYQYDQTETFGPPFSVPPQEIEELFGLNFSLERLVENDVLKSHQGLQKRGVTALTEYAWLLTRR
jgi:thiopurine S-methyltransferase